jgi:hypothetical protein
MRAITGLSRNSRMTGASSSFTGCSGRNTMHGCAFTGSKLIRVQ